VHFIERKKSISTEEKYIINRENWPKEKKTTKRKEKVIERVE
jgi:hypothetical protein